VCYIIVGGGDEILKEGGPCWKAWVKIMSSFRGRKPKPDDRVLKTEKQYKKNQVSRERLLLASYQA